MSACFYVLQGSFPQEPEVKPLIYRPAGEACLDFFNLKSQSPTLSVSYSPLRTCQLSFTAPPAICEDMCAAAEFLECLSCQHASAIGVLSLRL